MDNRMIGNEIKDDKEKINTRVSIRRIDKFLKAARVKEIDWKMELLFSEPEQRASLHDYSSYEGNRNTERKARRPAVTSDIDTRSLPESRRFPLS